MTRERTSLNVIIKISFLLASERLVSPPDRGLLKALKQAVASLWVWGRPPGPGERASLEKRPAFEGPGL